MFQEWASIVDDLKHEPRRVPPTFEGYVEPRTFIRSFSATMPSKAILAADVGQNQIWCANNFEIRDGRFLTTAAWARWVTLFPLLWALSSPGLTAR